MWRKYHIKNFEWQVYYCIFAIMPLQKMKVSPRNYFYLIAIFSITTILASILLALYTITENHKSLAYLDKSYGINARLDKISSTLKDEENHQKAYLITHKTSFLKSKNYTKKTVDQEISALSEILKKESEQQNQLSILKSEIELKIKILNKGEAYFLRGKIQHDSLVEIMTKGDIAMNEIKRIISEIKKTEYKRFSLLREKTFSQSELSIFIVALTSGISIVLLISILLALRNEHEAKVVIETKLIASEELLKKQVEMLNVSNKELEQFAYVASHDLEEPLRKISSFSEQVQIRLQNLDDDEVKDWLKRLNTSTARMKMLINDLLNYSRVSRALNTDETINLNTLFKVIFEDLDVAFKQKKAAVTIDNLTEIQANNTQIKQLFQNLISNALKFNDKLTPKIDIKGAYYSIEELALTGWTKDYTLKHNNYYCIFVSDNGIGFEAKYLKQIFVIFQRLHGRSEYEGTGIGLAICKRIVETHEGFITAESEIGKGTNFIVGLPATKQ